MDLSEATESSSKIQSVERAVAILGYFRVNRPHLSVPEITARAGLSRATVHRYVTVLRELNLLRFDPHTNTYSLGSRILTLAAAAAAGQPIVRASGPYLEALVRDTNETAVLSVWDGSAPVVVRVDDNSERTVRVSVMTGARLGIWDSAQGRVFCAFLPDGEAPGMPSGNRRKELRVDQDEIRRTRLSINTNQREGTRAVAAPVFAGERIVGALAVVGTVASIPAERTSSVAKAVLATSTRLSNDLGGPERG
jgi:DNA-binding IclR family transcriptional regulator